MFFKRIKKPEAVIAVDAPLSPETDRFPVRHRGVQRKTESIALGHVDVMITLKNARWNKKD